MPPTSARWAHRESPRQRPVTTPSSSDWPLATAGEAVPCSSGGGAAWVEPRTPREETLQLKLLKAQKELHRARSELARRHEHSAERHGKEEHGKPDWTLALRYRLTAELRAELTRLEEGWAGDKKRAEATIHTLQTTLESTKSEKEAMVTRLLKEVLELQRLYASANAQREAYAAALVPEVRQAEREHREHAAVLQQRLEDVDTARHAEVGRLKKEVGRLQAALTGVSEDLEDERGRKRSQHASMSMETSTLRDTILKLSEELASSQSQHARDVGVLKKRISAVEVEHAQSVESLKRQLAIVSAEKASETGELARALQHLKAAKERNEAQLKADLEHKELQRKAETSALQARVRHMRELQQQALAHVTGKARQMLYVAENVAAISSMDPDVRRRMGMEQKAAASPGLSLANDDPAASFVEGAAEGNGFDVDAAHQATKFAAALARGR